MNMKIINGFNTSAEELCKRKKAYWIQGPSGIGKSKLAYDIIKFCNKKNNNEHESLSAIFGKGYQIQIFEKSNIVLFDNFMKGCCTPKTLINLVQNKRPLKAKFGRKFSNFNIIMICSCYRINEIFPTVKKERRKMWEDYIEVIDFYN